MNNQFVLLHDAEDKEYPAWINLSLVLRIDEYKLGSKLQLVGDNQYFYAAESPMDIMKLAEG
jgi:hypothetical protein